MGELDNPEWFGLTPSTTAVKRKKLGLPSIGDRPIWTENKAKLIERYLYYFVWVTKHGTYIDAFAGPQRSNEHTMWAAKLVLENRPRYLRNFHLFEKAPESVAALRQLRDAQPPKARGESERTIHIYSGDCNRKIKEFLKTRTIRDAEATFCLLDQRTFECSWSTVEALAQYKQGGHNKIELFYFLANGWIDRAQSKKSDKDGEMKRWWGNEQWQRFFDLRSFDRQKLFSERFRNELGYKHVRAFPIYKRADGGATLYWMIHATDHDAAPVLMNAAYRQALKVKETADQMNLLECEVGRRPSSTP